MPKPELEDIMEKFRKALLANELKVATELIEAYGPIFTELSRQIDLLLAQAEKEALTIAQVQRLTRYQTLLSQVKIEVDKFSEFATDRIITGQGSSVEIALRGTQATVDASLPPGITLNHLDAVNLSWNRLPVEAFENFIGVAGDGKPLSNLLDPLGTDVQAGVRSAISEGITLGKGPRATATLVRQRTGMGLTRALTISRTEILRAYRESSRLQYAANPNIVKGYQRLSAKDDRVCPACIALDGTFYKTLVPLNEHVSGRCAIVPVTLTYKELGFDVPEPPRPQNAREWFVEQPASTQQSIMGPGRFKSWKAGDFELTDMAKITQDPVWGEAAITKPVKELVS